jgi:hypothetical protein
VTCNHQHHDFEQPPVELATEPERIAEPVGAVCDFRISETNGERTAHNPAVGTVDVVVDSLLFRRHILWRYVSNSCHLNLLFVGIALANKKTSNDSVGDTFLVVALGAVITIVLLLGSA